MNNWKRSYQHATADFPLTVHCYYPLEVLPEPRPLHRHPEIELLVFHGGQSQLYIQDQVLNLVAGDVALISPYELHVPYAVTPDVNWLSLRFPTELLEQPAAPFVSQELVEPLRSGTRKLPLVLRKGHPAYDCVWKALGTLHPDQAELPEYRYRLLSAVLLACGAAMAYPQIVEEKRPTSRAAEICMKYMNTHYQQKLTLEQIAQQVNMHPNYLCSYFKKETGQTVFSYLTDVRLGKALRLLNGTELTAGEVSRSCGFHSTGFFCQKFKERFHLTPKQYQKRFNR